MSPLSASRLLELWEQGEMQHPLDRALTALAFGFPDRDRAEFAALSVGQRDGLLLSLRESMFGPSLEAFATCPACEESLEFTLDTPDLLARSVPAHGPEFTLKLEGFEVQFRLPNSFDLALSADLEPGEARQRMLAQCIMEVRKGKRKVSAEALPEKLKDAVASRMLEYDPLAEVRLDLECPACEHRWPVILDAGAFFWAELESEAKRLLRQVHTLARFYGWREADILSMSARRRQFYLSMVNR
ncbi:MAG: phage baseplate protein [Dehalococcoidia bacterium]|nr:phage baseplate protein [Dehalococcoidia bacterium]